MPSLSSRLPALLGVFALAGVGSCASCGNSARAAALIEETLQVRVHGETLHGIPFDQSMTVDSVREAGAARRPWLILLHGRAADAAARARLSVRNYPANSRYFAAKGFAVLIPLRVGYGATGGPDVEFTGDCHFKHFADGVGPALSETTQLIDYAAHLPYVDPTRGLIVGDSFGGLVAIGAAAARLAGLKAVVNIAGGDGGDPLAHPDAPCRADQLEQTFGHFGAATRMPTLWMYSANDRLWGADLPRRWYAAFTGAGGTGRFEALPADRHNGHFIFTRNAAAWQPPFERFLNSLGRQLLLPP